MNQTDQDRAYRTLDGLRGVAALLVVTRHVGQFFPAGLFPESFLAVDLFFLLSGFVIAYAYEARLLAGRSLASFMKTRLIRLYPLYALGLVLGVGARVAATQADGAALDLVSLGQAIAIGLAMLPAAPFLPLGGSALDGPTWTLAPELVVNLVYASALKRLGVKVLWAITALGAIGLVASEWVYGTLNEGWDTRALPLLAARLVFSFFLGVLVFRYRPQRRVRPVLAWGCLVVLGAALTYAPPPAWRQAYELAAVTLAFPALLLVAVRAEPGRAGKRVFGWLGAVSYAVYVLHHPLGALAGTALDAFDALPAPSALTGVLFLAALAAIGTAADMVYDGPVRRWLSSLRRSRATRLRTELRPGEA